MSFASRLSFQPEPAKELIAHVGQDLVVRAIQTAASHAVESSVGHLAAIPVLLQLLQHRACVRVGPVEFDGTRVCFARVIYNGHVFVTSEEGDTFVIEAADQYRHVRVDSLDDVSMATLAIVRDRLLIRTQHRLYPIRNRR